MAICRGRHILPRFGKILGTVIFFFLLTTCGSGSRYELDGIRIGMSMEEVKAATGQQATEWQSGVSPRVNLQLLEQGLRMYYLPGRRFKDLRVVMKNGKVQQVRGQGFQDGWTPSKIEAELRARYGEPTKNEESSQIWWGEQIVKWTGRGFARRAKGAVMTVSSFGDPSTTQVELADFGPEWQDVVTTFAL